MPLYGLFYLIMASARVLHEDFIQQQIEEQGRSTVHSLISLMENLYGMAFFGVFSFVLSGVDLHKSLVFISLYIVFVSVVLWMIYNIKLREGLPDRAAFLIKINVRRQAGDQMPKIYT
jgi:hypothetical protein